MSERAGTPALGFSDLGPWIIQRRESSKFRAKGDVLFYRTFLCLFLGQLGRAYPTAPCPCPPRQEAERGLLHFRDHVSLRGWLALKASIKLALMPDWRMTDWRGEWPKERPVEGRAGKEKSPIGETAPCRPGSKILDSRVSAYYLVRSGLGLTWEGLVPLPSLVELLFLFKAHWEIPAAVSGVLWTVGLRFLILRSRKEQISDSWLQRKNHYVYQVLGSSVTFGAWGREGKCHSSLCLDPRFQEGIKSLENLKICLSSSCPFHFLSYFSFLSS